MGCWLTSACACRGAPGGYLGAGTTLFAIVSKTFTEPRHAGNGVTVSPLKEEI